MQNGGGPYAIGHTVGNYVLEEYLGGGAFKSVYRARAVDGPSVAIGFPHHQDKEGIADLEMECAVARSLTHPNIVRVHGMEHASGISFMVMDYVQGRSLRKILKEEGALPPARALEIVVRLSSALAYAHSKHVFHRDVKPENVLVDREGNPLLLDFGVARLLARTTEKRDTRVGTLEYMPPELLHGSAGTNGDIWALGVILYELLTGVRPFTGAMGEVVSKISSDQKHDESPLQHRSINLPVVRVLRKALAKNPEKRYARAEVFAQELELAARGARFVEDDESRLEVMLKASIPLIYLVSSEEDRALAAIHRISKRMPTAQSTERRR